MVDRDFISVIAKQRAVETGRSIAQTTSEWLQSGRDDEVVFSTARAAQIAVTEASWAVNTGKTMAAKSRGKRIQWVIGGKACPICRRLAGKIVTPGKSFGTHDGQPIFGPPVHPHCYCTIRFVR